MCEVALKSKIHLRSVKLCFLCVLLFTSCVDKESIGFNEQETHPEGVDTVKVGEVQDVLHASKILEDYKVVSLKTGDLLVGRISKVLFAKGNIYVSDKSKDQIFAFDKDGYMLFHINASGNGPEEYSKLNDLGINLLKGVIEVHDQPRREIAQYDMLTGRFVGRTKYDFWPINFSSLPNGSRLYYIGHMEQEPFRPDSLQSEAYITDAKNQILRSYIPHKSSGLNKIYSLSLENIYKSADDDLIFVPMYSNHIYKSEDNEIRLRYFLDFGKRSLPENFVLNFNEDPSRFTETFIESGFASYIESFYETSDHVFFTYYRRGKQFKVIYDKDTENSINYQFWNYDQYLFGVHPVGVAGDYFVTKVEPEMIRNRMSFFEKKVKPEARANYSEYVQLKALIDENKSQNPVLVFTKFKSLD